MDPEPRDADHPVVLELQPDAGVRRLDRRWIVLVGGVAAAVCVAVAGVVVASLGDHSPPEELVVSAAIVQESTSTTAPPPPLTVDEPSTTTTSAPSIPFPTTPPTSLPQASPDVDVAPEPDPPPTLAPVPPVGSPYSALELCPCVAENGLTFGGGPWSSPATVGTDFIAVLETSGVIGWLQTGDAVGDPSRFAPVGIPVYGSDGVTLIGHLVNRTVYTVFVPV